MNPKKIGQGFCLAHPDKGRIAPPERRCNAFLFIGVTSRNGKNSTLQEQEELLATYFKRVILMLDGDDAGRTATDECLKRLGRRMFVKALELPEGKQPDGLSREEIVLLLMKGKAST